MRRGMKVFIIFAVLFCYAFCTVSIAAEDNPGFFKRLFGKAKPPAETEVEEVPEEKMPEEEVMPDEPKDDMAVPEEITRPLEKDEMIEDIKTTFERYEDELLSRVQNVLVSIDDNGKLVYKFKRESGEVVGLEDLDLDEIRSLYNKVGNIAAVIHHERIMQRQKQIERIQRQTQGPVVPGEAQGPSGVPMPPRVPRTSIVPKQPTEILPSVPQPPSVPPSPPKAPVAPEAR